MFLWAMYTPEHARLELTGHKDPAGKFLAQLPPYERYNSQAMMLTRQESFQAQLECQLDGEREWRCHWHFLPKKSISQVLSDIFHAFGSLSSCSCWGAGNGSNWFLFYQNHSAHPWRKWKLRWIRSKHLLIHLILLRVVFMGFLFWQHVMASAQGVWRPLKPLTPTTLTSS